VARDEEVTPSIPQEFCFCSVGDFLWRRHVAFTSSKSLCSLSKGKFRGQIHFQHLYEYKHRRIQYNNCRQLNRNKYSWKSWLGEEYFRPIYICLMRGKRITQHSPTPSPPPHLPSIPPSSSPPLLIPPLFFLPLIPQLVISGLPLLLGFLSIFLSLSLRRDDGKMRRLIGNWKEKRYTRGKKKKKIKNKCEERGKEGGAVGE
jgi:hypothetical protein